uniref:CSON006908 protein n=1 Tax=Culicoides sonorensis TaxID=179676 RepID=A0A336KCD2_CULSO
MLNIKFISFILIILLVMLNNISGEDSKIEENLSPAVMIENNNIKKVTMDVKSEDQHMKEMTKKVMKNDSEQTFNAKSIEEQQELKCSKASEGQNSSKLIYFDEFKCVQNNNNGEYVHDVELIDGTRHKEEGIVINGKFTIRGFFFSKSNPKHLHIYINDDKGFNYYMVNLMNIDGTQEYGLGDEDEEYCNIHGNACIDPKTIASMIG